LQLGDALETVFGKTYQIDGTSFQTLDPDKNLSESKVIRSVPSILLWFSFADKSPASWMLKFGVY
jgi:hypothetical protein